ncbi:hypothetical protein QC823_14185 [Halomonas vilamensis]|uniref:Uncharacterized protein n=1 Tax=Vreelandella vilamensis TaxID=531309 RepID=A0ABU1H7N8_9GAMM|nr:hypothetical protein [Halomonas vilamensis]MDR5900130.1 hypothetical protein [Halomonas vilamensis]
MKVTEKVEVDAVTDVVCDVCLTSTGVAGGGLEFATLQAHWGYGSQHDGERYELLLLQHVGILQTRASRATPIQRRWLSW